MGHEGLVRALSFDPRTGRLVSVSYDKTVKVWDLWTGMRAVFVSLRHRYCLLTLLLPFVGKRVRNFTDVHRSHIFDVKFDASRIIT